MKASNPLVMVQAYRLLSEVGGMGEVLECPGGQGVGGGAGSEEVGGGRVPGGLPGVVRRGWMAAASGQGPGPAGLGHQPQHPPASAAADLHLQHHNDTSCDSYRPPLPEAVHACTRGYPPCVPAPDRALPLLRSRLPPRRRCMPGAGTTPCTWV